MDNVLVIQLARMGDLIQTKRLLLTLAFVKKQNVYLCVDDSLFAFANMIYPFAHVVSIPAHSGAGQPPSVVLSSTTQSFSFLEEMDFTRIYTLNNSPLSYALARLFPEEKVIGYQAGYGQEKRSKICHLAARWTVNRVASPLNLVDYWAHFSHNPIAPEKVNPIAKSSKNNRIGVALAGREQRRSLPAPLLAKCIEAVFQARSGPKIVCIGTKKEQRHVHDLAMHLPKSTFEQIEDTTGKTSLIDLPELISSLDCLLTPDTGVMHLAAHLGVPIQAFFLSSAWCFETGPYGLGHTIWQGTESCSPCLESSACKNNLQCLTPFSHKALLQHLSGRHTTSWPHGLTGYISRFDPLGVTYAPVDGEDTGHHKRKKLRSLLAEYFQCRPAIPSLACDEELFYERDWMLPGQKDLL